MRNRQRSYAGKDKKDKKDKKGPSKVRFIFVNLIFLSMFFITALRAFQIQVLQGPQLTEKAERHYKRVLSSSGKRGSILDVNGSPLAISMKSSSVAIRPEYFSDRERAISSFARILKREEDEIRTIFNRKGFNWLARKIKPETADKILEFTNSLNLDPGEKLYAIEVHEESSRAYPNKELAAQLIGFIGTDEKGLAGIESRYDSVLKGEEKNFTIIKDAKGRWFNKEKLVTEVSPGKDIVLSIDKSIQFITQNALSETARHFDAARGIALVLCPKTGAVKAMAHYPNFNPNNFKNYPENFWDNRAISEPFEPGSIMKVFLVAGAINRGYIKPESIYYCDKGSYKIGSITIKDTKAHEWLTTAEILKFSSNIGCVKISENMGSKALYEVLSDFGFGQKTDIGIPGESRGILRHWKNWTSVDRGNIAFGQGMSASALQLAMAAGAIANKGLLMQPYIIESIYDPKTDSSEYFEPRVLRRVVSPETAKILSSMMEEVTEEGGTGVSAAIKGHRVAGKTGTSQKIDPGGRYSKSRFIASFLGFAPVEDPALVVLVMLDEPRKNHYGGTVAGSAFSSIVSESLAYMNIVPSSAKIITTAMKDKENQ